MYVDFLCLYLWSQFNIHLMLIMRKMLYKELYKEENDVKDYKSMIN